MGACNAKLIINDELYLELKGNPNPSTLLMLQLHYDLYDSESKKKIDEVCQFSIMQNHTLVVGLVGT